MAVKLKTMYEKAEDIPEGYGELYTEKNGKFELTAVEGVKTQADVDRATNALVKERNDHKLAREKLQQFGEFDPAALPVMVEELAEAKAKLEALTAEGNDQTVKVQAQIDAAVNRAVGPITRDKESIARQLDAAKKAVAEKEAEVAKLTADAESERTRLAIRDAAIAAKVLPTAIDDAVLVGERMFETVDGKLLTKGDNGITPGLSPKEWAKEMEEKRPHWFPTSVGGGAQGGKGGGSSNKDNPFTAENWSVTKQGQLFKENPEKAAQMAARAGVKIGDVRPAKPRAAA
jgi:hypothetical protein